MKMAPSLAGATLGQDDASYLWTVQVDSDATPINTFNDPDVQGNGYMPFSITL